MEWFWRVVNPLVGPLSGIAPWWLRLETLGRRSGARRVVPLAVGSFDGRCIWLVAVHGRHSDFVRNLEADSAVRVLHRRRWHRGIATTQPLDQARVATYSAYVRSTLRVGIDPLLVRIELTD